MPRKKGSNVNNTNGSAKLSTSDYDRDSLRWCNIKLEDDDLAALEQSDATLEYLAARLCEISSDGINASIRHVDGGKSVCVSLLFPVSRGAIRTIGISSFGGNIRDAILCTVYKFDIRLDGDIESAIELLSTETAQRRFR